MTPIKILVVDDESSLVELSRLILEEAGYQVRVAMNGLQALDLVTEEMPDLILLDVMMPGMNGIDVCRTIRTRHHQPLPTILMYTADDSSETRRSSLQAGANALIPKDIPIFELPQKIGRYLPAP